ncbi:hypothetical protein ACQR16_32565 [Bradyrhizobium oligotrophicum]|uniref:hypothetical protein n=1 Tax=Bradyrhizobium oligotrophicum TaxID=44255 RepID=UPI003EC0496D
MSAGLSHLPSRKLGAAASPAVRRRADAQIPLGTALMGLAAFALIMFGAVAWLIMSSEDGETVDGGGLARLVPDTSGVPYAGDEDATEPARGFSSVVPGASSSSDAHVAGSSTPSPVPRLMDANASLPPASPPVSSAALDPAILSGLRISSQSWRRGGLGSKALVTFTLRNTNTFAIKDIEINCAFSRRDGSHVTDRRRVIQEEVRSRSRRTFASVHVGFVNVNVSTAKCTLVAATKI